MPWLRLRTIVFEHEAETEQMEALTQFKRFREAWDGLEWLLARDSRPEGSFSLTTKDGVEFFCYGAYGQRATDAPDMWVVYTYDENQVVIHGINASEASPDEDEEE